MSGECEQTGEVCPVGEMSTKLAALHATVEAQAAEIADLHAVESVMHRGLVETNAAYNVAHGITDGRWADLGALFTWLLDERRAQAKQIETMREALGAIKRHQEIIGGTMAAISVTHRIASDALSSLAPSDMRLVLVDRLRGLEKCALRLFMFSDSILGEGKAAELLGVDIITLNRRAAAIKGDTCPE